MTLDRRAFLKAGAAQAALLGVGLSGCATHPGAGGVPRGANPFRHGVASGDPLADGVILWTRVSPDEDRMGEPVRTDWWIARDPLGLEVVAGGQLDALPDRDYTVKIDVGRLEPATEYYYGFLTRTGLSPVGRTRTLPEGDVDHVRLAFTSCSNYPNGFFNAYAALAQRDDLDVVLHLGDYIYEYGNGEYGDGTAIGRIPDPPYEILDLADYRRRHACYKSDPDLQSAHARHPWIAIWDDHEIANNAYRGGAQNHDASEGDWETRKLAAIRAYHEWMPIRQLPTGLFRRFRFGDLADLIMLDTRLQGRDAQPRPRDQAAARDPSRSMLGEEQTGWLLDALSDSFHEGTVWRVIGQQIVFAPLTDGHDAFNPDAWDGYRANRRQVLDHLEREHIDNVVILTGDVHSAWAMDVPVALGEGSGYDPRTGEGSRAVELVTPAVSSPALGSSGRAMDELRDIQQRIPHVRYANLLEHGFVLLDLTPARARAEFVFSDPIDRRSSATHAGPSFETRSHSNHLSSVDSDSAARSGGSTSMPVGTIADASGAPTERAGSVAIRTAPTTRVSAASSKITG